MNTSREWADKWRDKQYADFYVEIMSKKSEERPEPEDIELLETTLRGTTIEIGYALRILIWPVMRFLERMFTKKG